MAATESTMMALGTKAPDFTLPDTISGTDKSLNELASDKATVVMFICNHCPYVIHVRDEIVRMAKEYTPKGVSFIAINSNDATIYVQDSPEYMRKAAAEFDFNFPYLFDESQDVARAYDAACTPDFFVFDGKMECVYRGQLDDSRPRNDIPVTGKDLREALDALLSGMPVNPEQTPSIGCNIKWKR